MEVRVIKTCQGFETVRFLDGALLPLGLDLREVTHVELVEEMTLQEWHRQFVPFPTRPAWGQFQSFNP